MNGDHEHQHPHSEEPQHSHAPAEQAQLLAGVTRRDQTYDAAPHPTADEHHDHAAHDDADFHGHDHGSDDHSHGLGATVLDAVAHFIPFMHGHAHANTGPDTALESSERGIRAVKLSLLILAITAGFQIAIVVISGSVSLLADTVHNFTDAATAIPLWIAFVLGRRPATRRYTYGFGRAEDLAGVAIVAIILSSALFAAYESIDRLLNPRDLDNIPWIIVAAITGFIGNEVVANLRINTGREIGSAALVADGQHARIDGLTSLAVLCGAVGVALGFELADPLVGLLISLAILGIVKDAATSIWYRMMDAIDPEVLDSIEATAKAALKERPGVGAISDVRVRWLGHKLQVELSVLVDENMTTRKSHDIAEELRHALYHSHPNLTSILVHTEPATDGSDDPHELTRHHIPLPRNTAR